MRQSYLTQIVMYDQLGPWRCYGTAQVLKEGSELDSGEVSAVKWQAQKQRRCQQWGQAPPARRTPSIHEFVLLQHLYQIIWTKCVPDLDQTEKRLQGSWGTQRSKQT